MSLATTQTESQAEVSKWDYSKDVEWYFQEPDNLRSTCRELFEKYSHIPPEEVLPHILEIVSHAHFPVHYLSPLTSKQRDKAWALVPYPCIGRFRFLELSISQQPCYPRVLSFLKEPHSQHTLLDIGCCFAQDVRKLVYDGVPSENLYACDLERDFLTLSYDLFKDVDTMKGHLFTANALEEVDAPLDELQGKMDVVYAGSFLHLFNWDDQLRICKRIIKTLKPAKGSLLFGRQIGAVRAGEREMLPAVGGERPMVWRHDAHSFKRLWEVAGSETGTKWKTWSQLDGGEGMVHNWNGDPVCRLIFEVERLE